MNWTAEVGGGTWEKPDPNADEHLWKPGLGSSHIPHLTSTIER